jgi:cystathionine beta-lyase/cystathionine gamma-synthase
LGGKLSPFEAWLLLRGLRTLNLRLEAHQKSALEIAAKLEQHEKVAKVNCPGLKSFAQADLAKKLGGTTGLMSFELNADREGIKRFINSLEYFKLGVSWGGHESLVFPITLGLLNRGALNPYDYFGIPENTVRIHVGLEDVHDLWTDLETALEKI